MKILKWIGLVILVVIVLGIILMLILPKTVKTEESIVIAAPPEAVWPMIASLQAQQTWSPWAAMDSTMQVQTFGEPGTVGEKHKWVGEKMGTGEMEITAMDPMKRVDVAMHFLTPREGKARSWIILESVDEGSKVTWGYAMQAPMPSNLLLYLMNVDGAIGKDYQKGLHELKAMVEDGTAMSNAGTADYSIDTGHVEEKTFLVITDTVSIEEMGLFFETSVPLLMGELERQHIEPGGPLTGIFRNWNQESESNFVAVGIEVDPGVTTTGDFELITVPAAAVIMTDYYGAYDDMKPAYDAMGHYVAEHELVPGAFVIEEYLTSPKAEPDTANWQTRVIFYLK